jgi:hypothetical protein
MSSTVRRVAVVAGGLAIAVALRRHLVDLLTKTTGTWVGSPPTPEGER